MPHIRLVVIGASGRIGREVARLGVAYGAQVIGVDPAGPPAKDEPWTSGVAWHRADGAQPGAWLDEATGVVIAAAIDPHPVLEAAKSRGIERVVVLGDRTGIASVTASDQVILAVPHDVVDAAEDPELPSADDTFIRVERLAMALLRAALDENIPPTLDHAALCELGDAMFWQ